VFSRMFECCAHFHSRRQSVGNDDGAGAPHSTVTAVNMACVFKDSQAVILVDFVPSGSIVNADYYSTLLSAPSKTTKFVTKGVILQHDNAPPHKARQTVEQVAMTGWQLLPHPPCSPGK